MNKYIFTFGVGQTNSGRYQIIFAEDYEAARNIMIKHYGRRWCMGYDEEQWVEIVADMKYRGVPVEFPLEKIIYQEKAVKKNDK
jgi:hypothetical protein